MFDVPLLPLKHLGYVLLQGAAVFKLFLLLLHDLNLFLKLLEPAFQHLQLPIPLIHHPVRSFLALAIRNIVAVLCVQNVFFLNVVQPQDHLSLFVLLALLLHELRHLH